MLKSLSIRNIALIDSVEIEFDDGLTVLSGETGSGKSIIIDSLAFVLGDRADKTLIKYGEEEAEVTALFQVEPQSPVLSKLVDFGYGDDEEILISRKMTAQGKNEIRIQGRTATLSILKEVCGELVDIFGQGQHLALLNEKNQLSVLDSFCNFNGADVGLKDEYVKLAAVNRELKSFGGSDAERERLADILKFQIDEIRAAELDEQEEENLLNLHKRAVNAEKIAQALSVAVENLNGENGALSQISTAADSLRTIVGVESEVAALVERLSACRIEAQDIALSLENLLNETDFSPFEADRVETRLDKIKTIKRKYGGTVAEALKFLEDAEQRYENLTNSTETIARLNNEKMSILNSMFEISQKKSAERRRVALILSQKITSELDDLGMRNTRFEVHFNEEPSFEEFCGQPSSDGFDKVSFLMSANAGEPLKPLAKVISGGEMSRFMLAVKNITAHAERIPTMVFDEIDSGISGNMAQMVAKKLANVSTDRQNGFQCIVITHLPQIAAMGDVSVYISKIQKDGRTVTEVKRLYSRDERAAEVARLMGSVGEHAIVSAVELLDYAQNYKNSLK